MRLPAPAVIGMTIAVLAVAQPRLAAQAVPPAPRERVHPELVDSTWGGRVQAAWHLAWASDWPDARGAFTRLHEEQPDAVEPLIGLGFVARGTKRYGEARELFLRALALEPSSADARAQLEAADWDRPGSVEIAAGSSRLGTVTRSTATGGVVVPLNASLTLTAGAGVFGGGDPLRGIFLDSTNAGARTTLVSGGLVFTPTSALALSTRAERWAGGGTTTNFVWIEGSARVSQQLAVRAGIRPVSGAQEGDRAMLGADVAPGSNTLLSVDASQAVHAGPFEARTIARAFAAITPNVRWTARAGVVRDIDPRLAATTVVGSAGWFATPVTGLRADVSRREGAFPQTSGSLALLVRW